MNARSMESMSVETESLEKKMCIMQAELLKLQIKQNDICKRQADIENKMSKILAKMDRKSSNSSKQFMEEAEIDISPYFSGRKEENVEKWISYLEKKLKPTRTKFSWCLLEKFVTGLPLDWIKNCKRLNPNFDWPVIRLDLIYLFKWPDTNWSVELQSYCGKPLQDQDMMRILVILCSMLGRNRIVDICNQSFRARFGIGSDIFSKIYGFFIYGNIDLFYYDNLVSQFLRDDGCHVKTMEYVLMQGQNTDWTWQNVEDRSA
jgi:hypothetical protein